jgi:hypothetical protein
MPLRLIGWPCSITSSSCSSTEKKELLRFGLLLASGLSFLEVIYNINAH